MPTEFRPQGARLEVDVRQRLSKLLHEHGDVKVSRWFGVTRNTLWRAAAGGTLQQRNVTKITEELATLERVARGKRAI
jgi:hypothetical protein